MPRLSKSKRKRLVWAWLEENCGADGWAMTSSGSRGVLNDACRSISPILLWRACSPLGWWRGRQRRAGRSTACPRAILHSRPGAADCRRSRQVGRQATKPRNEAYLARNRRFESSSLQQGVSCEPDFLYQGAENFAGRRRGTNHRPTTKGFAASEFALVLTRLARRRSAITAKRRDATCVQFRIGYGATFLLHTLGAKR